MGAEVAIRQGKDAIHDYRAFIDLCSQGEHLLFLSRTLLFK